MPLEEKPAMSTGESEPDVSAAVAEGARASLNRANRDAKRKLELEVAITDVGPCKKHLKITIPRAEIDRQYEESLEIVAEGGGRSRVSAGPRAAATGRQAVPQAGLRAGQVEPADVVARADRQGLQARADRSAAARRRGDRDPRKRADELRDGRRGAPAVRRAPLQGAQGQAAGRGADRERRRRPAEAVPGRARHRSCPSSKGAPRSAIISRPT